MNRPAARRSASPLTEDVDAPIPAEFRLQSGDRLDDARVRIRRFGAPDAPLVAALGGISSGRDVCGPDGWWRETLEPAVDPERFAVLGVDFAPLADQRVRITPHDQARLVGIALDHLGRPRLHAFVGASYGAMVGLAFAALTPERLGRLCVIAAAHKPSAQALAWRGVQRRMVEFGLAHGDGAGGLSLARQLAMITYRTGAEFEQRFGAGVAADGLGDVDRYLRARGDAYAQLPHRWLSLSEAIDRFSVDPRAITTPTTLVASPDDQLAPFADIAVMAGQLPRLRASHSLSSLYGHDAFLKEPERLTPLIRAFLEEAAYG